MILAQGHEARLARQHTNFYSPNGFSLLAGRLGWPVCSSFDWPLAGREQMKANTSAQSASILRSPTSWPARARVWILPVCVFVLNFHFFTELQIKLGLGLASRRDESQTTRSANCELLTLAHRLNLDFCLPDFIVVLPPLPVSVVTLRICDSLRSSSAKTLKNL